MQVNSTSTAATAASASKSGDALSSFGKNFDNFLTLLTAQLQNQDPLSPLNPTEFTTQLVQFTAVEQAIRQNKNLEELIALQKSAQTVNAVGYVGKTVEAKGSSVFLSQGKGEFSYSLDAAANKTTITITDSTGKVVRNLVGEGGKGAHTVSWDGRDNNGIALADGAYKIAVSATDAAGKAVSASTTVTGKVTGITTANGAIGLTVGSLNVPLADIVAVRDASST